MNLFSTFFFVVRPFDLAQDSLDCALPLQLFLDVKGKHFVPIHWGTFYMPEVGDEPIKLVEAEARRLEIVPERLLLLKHGESRPW